ncbi:MAG: pyridoxamine 5'-phosphate oxidase family protein [Chloroflexi bacterium]|nr:pyridoxamine 5'-phosphate oxidase family protein [Chloroflexota bacterium]
MAELSPDEILNEALRVAHSQFGGTLATVHADDGTPYPAFVLFHLTDEGEVIYGSVTESQHTRDTEVIPEVAFLIDNRDVLGYDWPAFDRVTVEGTAERIDPDDPRYDGYFEELTAKNWLSNYFTTIGNLYCIAPRRITVVLGLGPERHTLDFD